MPEPNDPTLNAKEGSAMQKTAKRLGRGLSSLISVADDIPIQKPVVPEPPTEEAAAILVDVGLIRPNPFQPRKDIAPQQLQALAESIKKTGLLQPIVLRRKGPQLYEL